MQQQQPWLPHFSFYSLQEAKDRMNYFCTIATVTFFAASPGVAAGVPQNSASFEFGAGAQVQMVRVATQSMWSKRWWQSNGTHVGGYWDISAAQWRGNAYRNVHGQHQHITDLGLTPVFRLQADDVKGWYVEGGIGAHVLSDKYDNDGTNLSTSFQFGDHLGVGYVFNTGWDAALKVQHFSNGGIKRPNDGADFLILKLGRRF